MDAKEMALWKIIDIGGYAAYATFFSFTLEAIKNRVEKENKDLQELRDKLNSFYANINGRFQAINIHQFDKKIFPVDVIREIRDSLFPELGKKLQELESLLKFYLNGSSHLKIRIAKKVEECDQLITKMGELGQEFSKNSRYWEYRDTKPERDYLEKPQ